MTFFINQLKEDQRTQNSCDCRCENRSYKVCSILLVCERKRSIHDPEPDRLEGRGEILVGGKILF